MCLACITTHAQKMDKNLLYGKWETYSMQFDGISVCRDSLTEHIQESLLVRKAKHPTEQLTPNDSIKLVDSVRAGYSEMFNSYMTFDEKGNTTVMLGFEKNINGTFSEETGTYEWTGENKIFQKLERSHSVLIIIELTTKRLTIKPEVLYKKDEMLMTYTRAK